MADGPARVCAETVDTNLRSVFDTRGPVCGHSHRLQELNQRGLFSPRVFDLLALAYIPNEGIQARGAFNSSFPDRGLDGKFVVVAVDRDQFNGFVHLYGPREGGLYASRNILGPVRASLTGYWRDYGVPEAMPKYFCSLPAE